MSKKTHTCLFKLVWALSAKKYIMVIIVWLYIPELTRSNTQTHMNTHTPKVPGVHAEWCTVLQLPSAMQEMVSTAILLA